MEQFECKTKIIAGAGAVSTLKELGAKRMLLVTDPYFAQTALRHELPKWQARKKRKFSTR